MKINFGMGLDGYETVLPRQMLAMPICGPLGLLQLLETRLGLKTKTVSSAHRVVEFRQILEQLSIKRPTFYNESFKKDPYAVAETLLQWRDALIEAGWDGLAFASDTARIQDMAAVEALTTNRLPLGIADRLRSVLTELASRSPKLDSLTVRDLHNHLPKLWRLICEKLGARYEAVAFGSATDAKGGTSDLVQIQSLLRENNSSQHLKLRGDGSILCLTAFSEITLANGAAQLLQSLRQTSNTAITLVAAESAGPLEQALSSLNEPTVGFQPSSTARPIPQVLLLALRLYWKPVDPRALLEFLAHPACPVADVLRFKLANVIAECPGIGGPQWQAAVAATKENIENYGKLNADEKKQAIERIEQDLKNWLAVAEFDAKAGASGSKLSECCARVGNAIPRTWRWLNGLTQDGEVDFGINAMTVAVDSLHATGTDKALAAMLSPTTDAPVLLPAYLDCWVQTNPSPAADPDVALFLHGPQREMADVQVCWRGDLPDAVSEDDWTDILSLCPPTTTECLPVPLHVFRDWLGSRGKFEDSSGDVVEIQQPPEKKKNEEERGTIAFVWRGPDDRFFARRAADLRPGDTIVLRVQDGGWQALGHLPGAPDDPQATPDKLLTCEEVRCVDVAEPATASARRRAILRIQPALWTQPRAGTAAAALNDMALDSEKDWHIPEIKELLARLLNEENPGWALTSDQREVIGHLAKQSVRLYVESYPSDQGFVLTARDLLPHRNSDETNETGETDADTLLEAVQPQELCDHTKDVLARIESALALLPLSAWCEALIAATAVHDWGKVDPRFQAMLRGTTPFAAMASETFLAKSGSIAFSTAARRAARQRAELPDGFRHEMLSVQMAENSVGATALPTNPVHLALALHLIATHHGYSRPFAPLVDDDTPPAVSLPMNGKTIVITGVERLEHPTHALDSGLAERFWQMNRHYGWWGIAFLEAVLRLADQSASANPQAIPKP